MKMIRLAGVALALTPTIVLAQTGAADYKAKCAMCHGADGAAATPMGKKMNVHSFKSADQIALSDQAMFDATKKGKGKMMPSYANKLTDNQIKDIVKYIRTLQK